MSDTSEVRYTVGVYHPVVDGTPGPGEYVVVYCLDPGHVHSLAIIPITPERDEAAAIKVGRRIAACPELAGGTEGVLDLRGFPPQGGHHA